MTGVQTCALPIFVGSYDLASVSYTGVYANVSNAIGVQAAVQVGSFVANSNAWLGTAYGVYTYGTVGSASGSLTSSVNTYYDAYLDGVTINSTGSVGSKYGVYQTKTDHTNYFAGNVGIGTSNTSYKLHVVGSFAATTKSFVIDHPTKSDMKLRYGSLEGPENGV